MHRWTFPTLNKTLFCSLTPFFFRTEHLSGVGCFSITLYFCFTLWFYLNVHTLSISFVSCHSELTTGSLVKQPEDGRLRPKRVTADQKWYEMTYVLRELIYLYITVRR
jgi:hypothetical protein